MHYVLCTSLPSSHFVATNITASDSEKTFQAVVTNSRITRRPSVSCCSPKDDYFATLQALKSKNRFPRKSLGQNYMLNTQINKELAAAAGVREGDVVLEIGPGTGALTNVLLSAGASVLGIEKDPFMAEIMNERFDENEMVEIIVEDVTRCCLESRLTSFLEKREKLDGKFHAKVVSNIPFNISADVVKLLLPMGHIISEVVLLLQDETAFRLAYPILRTHEYRAINIFVNFYSVPSYKLKVPRANFFPQPNVDAAIAVFKLKQATHYPRVASSKDFFSMVRAAFNGKRKMLRNSLKHMHPPAELERALQRINRPETARPEELTLGDFVQLHNIISEGMPL